MLSSLFNTMRSFTSNTNTNNNTNYTTNQPNIPEFNEHDILKPDEIDKIVWYETNDEKAEVEDQYWLYANMNCLSRHIQQVHDIQEEYIRKDKQISTYMFNETWSMTPINKMPYNANQTAYMSATNRGRPQSGIYHGSSNLINSKDVDVNVMKVWNSGIIVIQAYANKDTDHNKLYNYIRSINMSNNNKVIFIIDANDKKDYYTYLCKDVLGMSQLDTGYTYYSKMDDSKSRNDLIFFKNIELELDKQILPREDHNDSDHTPIVFKIKTTNPKLIKHFYNWKKLDNDSILKEKFNAKVNEFLNNNEFDLNYCNYKNKIQEICEELGILIKTKRFNRFRIHFNKEDQIKLKEMNDNLKLLKYTENYNAYNKQLSEINKFRKMQANKQFSQFLYDKSSKNQHQTIIKKMIRRGTLKPNNKNLKNYKYPNIGNSVEEFWEKWTRYYEEKFELSEIDEELIYDFQDHPRTEEANYENPNYMRDIKFEIRDLEMIFKAADPNKAPGPDGMGYGVWRCCFEANKEKFCELYNAEFNKTEAEDDYRDCDICPIYKEGNLEDPANFRPIALGNNFYKLLELGFNHKIKYDHIFSNHQHGYRPGKNCGTYINDIHAAMQNFREGIIVKIDLKKAFDKVNRAQAIKRFINVVGHYKFLYKMKDLYEVTRLRILTDFGASDWIDAYQGIMQGSRVSPGTYVSAQDSAIEYVNNNSVCIAKAYCDDITLVCPRDKGAIKRAITMLALKLREVGLEISTDKLKWLRFGESTQGTNELKIFRKVFKRSSKFKIVGVFFRDRQPITMTNQIAQRKKTNDKFVDDKAIQKYILNKLIKDIPARKIIFVSRFVQRYYYGATFIANLLVDRNDMIDKYNPNWYDQDESEDVRRANHELAKDSLMMIQGKVFAYNVAAVLGLTPLHMIKSKSVDNFEYWIKYANNQSAEFMKDNKDNLMKLAASKKRLKGAYKVLKYYCGFIEAMVMNFNQEIEKYGYSYPICRLCHKPLNLDCFDKDERNCSKCGLWIEGNCPKNKVYYKDEEELFIKRLDEINESEWGEQIFLFKVQGLFNMYEVWNEVKQVYEYKNMSYEEYIKKNWMTKEDDDIHNELEYDGDYNPDDFVTNYDFIPEIKRKKTLEINELVDNTERYQYCEMYTDGSASSNYRVASSALVYLIPLNAEVRESVYPIPGGSTNNYAELYGIYQAVRNAYDQNINQYDIRINTDSEYSINAIYYFKAKYQYNLRYLKNINESQRKVKNIEIMEKIFKVMKKLEEEKNVHVAFRHIKAHTSDPELSSPEYYNAKADKLCREDVRRRLNEELDSMFEENELSDEPSDQDDHTNPDNPDNNDDDGHGNSESGDGGSDDNDDDNHNDDKDKVEKEMNVNNNHYGQYSSSINTNTNKFSNNYSYNNTMQSIKYEKIVEEEYENILNNKTIVGQFDANVATKILFGIRDEENTTNPNEILFGKNHFNFNNITSIQTYNKEYLINYNQEIHQKKEINQENLNDKLNKIIRKNNELKENNLEKIIEKMTKTKRIKKLNEFREFNIKYVENQINNKKNIKYLFHITNKNIKVHHGNWYAENTIRNDRETSDIIPTLFN